MFFGEICTFLNLIPATSFTQVVKGACLPLCYFIILDIFSGRQIRTASRPVYNLQSLNMEPHCNTCRMCLCIVLLKQAGTSLEKQVFL